MGATFMVYYFRNNTTQGWHIANFSYQTPNVNLKLCACQSLFSLYVSSLQIYERKIVQKCYCTMKYCETKKKTKNISRNPRKHISILLQNHLTTFLNVLLEFRKNKSLSNKINNMTFILCSNNNRKVDLSWIIVFHPFNMSFQ